MGVIFLSYRRLDRAGAFGRIYDRLRSRFGKNRVFLDVKGIGAGVQFSQFLTRVIQQTDVFLAIIGPHWLDSRANDGTRRLDDPTDFVRREVETALRQGVPIIPVLIDDAAMPSSTELPESLRGLAAHNAIAIRQDPDFDDDVDRLVTAITKLRARRHRSSVDRLAALSVYVAFALACAVFIGAALDLLGISLPIGGVSPLRDVLHRAPLPALVVTGLLALATLSSLVLVRAGAPSGAPVPEELEASMHTGWRGARQGVALATSSASALTLFALLVVTLARPSWCPTALCLPPQLVTRGVHDANMDVYLTTLQSPDYALAEDPAHYTDRDLPRTTAAQLVDTPAQPPYRVVIGVHSLLQQGSYSLILEDVQLVVDSVTPLPQPLNVWEAGSLRNYNSNPYHVTYDGQAPGAQLLALYTLVPGGHVQLAPGEEDELDLQVLSHVPAALRFHVQLTYRVANQAQTHTIALPDQLDVVFATGANWHVYDLVNGRLVAAPP
jgi:hypothetical protein